jgi:hypothetical protein
MKMLSELGVDETLSIVVWWRCFLGWGGKIKGDLFIGLEELN